MNSLRGFVLVSALLAANAEIRLGLDSGNVRWFVRNRNNSINAEATVPGGIYTDLQNAGILDQNLFYRFNDIDYRWVSQDDWTYRTDFFVPEDVFKKAAVNLVFHGVDTVARIRLNGKPIASANNMFVRHVIPVKEHVVQGNNSLEVEFSSPIAASKALFNAHNYTVPPECVPPYYNGECHVNFLRKMQASFSWDWGPAFPSMGLWKAVELEAFDSAVLRDVTVAVADLDAATWSINATAYVETARSDLGNYSVYGQLSTKLSEAGVNLVEVTDEGSSMVIVLNFLIAKDRVDLWWPNGFGAQPLYRLAVSFRSQTYRESSDKEMRIGVRTVELVQERIKSKDGLTFFFRVNGVAIFAKGSNWIPSHILPERSYDEDRIRELLMSSRDVHMNMLRVWGGGLYESDLFYQIADELGIMIWQDMMFACAMYPANEEFLDNVRIETEQQVKRLQHHPSIVLWAGNNENEAALRGNWYNTDKAFDAYKADYVKLYVDTIKRVVFDNDETRSYAVSSPSNGIASEAEGYVSKDPYSPLYGDIHFYNYILDPWSPDTYPNTRFASEYGFQSLPSMKTMSEVSLPSDRKIESQFSAKRQHLLAGYLLMTLLIKERLPLPLKEDTEEYYENFIYLSQVSQAMGVKTETEKYRRDRNKLTKNGEGRTMGAMYWQLNDVWQAPTWSSIDFNGRWKMLHYFAKKFFSPVLISPDVTFDDRLNVFVVSDLLHDVPDAEMNITMYSWDSFDPVKVITSKEVIRSGRSKIHARFDLGELFAESGCNKTTCFIRCSLSAAAIDVVDNFLFPSKFSKVTNLSPANISVDVVAESDNAAEIQVETSAVAPFVWLETDEPGQFSENGFTLFRRKKLVTFANRNAGINVDNLRRSLTVRSLRLPTRLDK